MSLEEMYLKQNDFVLYSTAKDENYVLRVVDAKPEEFKYFPEENISGFKPLNAFNAPAVSGVYDNYVVDSEELSLQEFTNISNMFEADNMGYDHTNVLMQVFMGIAPSWIRVFKYFPSRDKLGDYLFGDKVYWGGRQQKYNFGYVDGFRSKKNKPTYSSEFFVPPVSSFQFTFMNPSLVPSHIELALYINQMIVEPVSDVQLAHKILNRIVPAKRAKTGQFPNGFTPTHSLFGVSPVPLDATQNDLQNAGYGGA